MAGRHMWRWQGAGHPRRDGLPWQAGRLLPPPRWAHHLPAYSKPHPACPLCPFSPHLPSQDLVPSTAFCLALPSAYLYRTFLHTCYAWDTTFPVYRLCAACLYKRKRHHRAEPACTFYLSVRAAAPSADRYFFKTRTMPVAGGEGKSEDIASRSMRCDASSHLRHPLQPTAYLKEEEKKQQAEGEEEGRKKGQGGLPPVKPQHLQPAH